jgi:hypothetical protein
VGAPSGFNPYHNCNYMQSYSSALGEP